MLCSAKELKLSDDHGGLLELPDNTPVGADIREVLSLDDTLFTLKLTPNLAHCLSVYGVPRELARLSKRRFSRPWRPVSPTRCRFRLARRICADGFLAALCEASTPVPAHQHG